MRDVFLKIENKIANLFYFHIITLMSLRGIKKNEQYVEERKNILNDLKNILNISDENNKIYINEFNNNEYAQNKILKLKDGIGKYFYGKNNMAFKKDSFLKKNKECISLIKIVLKEMEYEIIRVEKKIKDGEIYVYNNYYLIQKSV